MTGENPIVTDSSSENQEDAGILQDRRIRIIGGRAGVGKSEFACNYALRLAQRQLPVLAVDLDIVNPYFTTREARGLLEAHGISVTGPTGDLTANDLPALPPDVNRAFAEAGLQVVIDMGGGLNGARALGPYRTRLLTEACDFFLVMNACRPYHGSAGQVKEFAETYQRVAGLPLTGLVNNTHLMQETGTAEMELGEELACAVSAETAMRYRYLCVSGNVEPPGRTGAEQVFRIKRYLRHTWME